MAWPKGRPAWNKSLTPKRETNQPCSAICKTGQACGAPSMVDRDVCFIHSGLRVMGWPKGRPHSDQHKQRCLEGRRNGKGFGRSVECRERISEALTGKPLSEAHKIALGAVASHSWYGGDTGDAFAEVLCPAGYVREHLVYYGERIMPVGYGGLRRRYFRLDFAHVEGKINIELDGPNHKTQQAEDQTRDAILRELGWKVIRIKHGASA